MSGRNRYGVYRREREHRRWFGDEKQAYVTEEEAWANAAQLNLTKVDGELRVEYYECLTCGYFHIGKKYPRRRSWPEWWWRNNHEVLLIELGERALGCLGVENSSRVGHGYAAIMQRIRAAHTPRKGIANHYYRRKVRTR